MTLDQTIRLKAELLLGGLSITDDALATVGHGGLEKTFWVFEMTPVAHPGTGDGTRPLPNDMLLPYDLYVDVRYNPNSPYTVHQSGSALVLLKKDTEICEVHWANRPDFYDKQTRSGVPMKKVASMRGDCGLRLCYDNACNYFAANEQCKFCNIVPARQRNRDHVVTVKKAEDFYDVYEEAVVRNPICSHLAITAGAARDDGLGHLPAILERIQPLLAQRHVPIVAAITATLDRSETESLRDLGVDSVAFNLEVWDAHRFAEICPGKNRRVGRARWLEALMEARDIFEPGRVLSSFVVGLEEKETLLAGIDYLSSEGIWPIMSPFIPMVGTAYEGAAAPAVDWMWDVHEKATEILSANLPDVFSEEMWEGAIGICPSCTTTKLFFDFMRRLVPRENPRRVLSPESVVAFV